MNEAGGNRMPLYVQLAQQLRQSIRSGDFVTGDILPGELVLASRYEVSPDTVRRAVRLLREEQVVVVQRGKGNVVQELPPVVIVTARRGDAIIARLPDEIERQQLGLPEGVPVLAIRRAASGEEELYDGNRTQVEYVS